MEGKIMFNNIEKIEGFENLVSNYKEVMDRLKKYNNIEVEILELEKEKRTQSKRLNNYILEEKYNEVRTTREYIKELEIKIDNKFAEKDKVSKLDLDEEIQEAMKQCEKLVQPVVSEYEQLEKNSLKRKKSY